MRSIRNHLASIWLLFISTIAGAAVDQADKLAPEPTVNGVWIVVFLVLFVLFCVGVGIGIYRADKNSKSPGGKH